MRYLMSRPKGHKSDHGYSVFADFDGGLGYKEIAQKMTDGGHKMNLSTARNVLISAMDKIATNICNTYDISVNSKDLKRISSDPRFQSGIHDLLAERANKKDDQNDA